MNACQIQFSISKGADGAGQMQHFVNDDGFNVFRLPVSWQFFTNNVLGGPVVAANLAEYDDLVQVCRMFSISQCGLHISRPVWLLVHPVSLIFITMRDGTKGYFYFHRTIGSYY